MDTNIKHTDSYIRLLLAHLNADRVLLCMITFILGTMLSPVTIMKAPVPAIAGIVTLILTVLTLHYFWLTTTAAAAQQDETMATLKRSLDAEYSAKKEVLNRDVADNEMLQNDVERRLAAASELIAEHERVNQNLKERADAMAAEITMARAEATADEPVRKPRKFLSLPKRVSKKRGGGLRPPTT